MEDTLRVSCCVTRHQDTTVLILVLMEDTLRVSATIDVGVTHWS